MIWPHTFDFVGMCVPPEGILGCWMCLDYLFGVGVHSVVGDPHMV